MNRVRKSLRGLFFALALAASLPASAGSKDDALYQLLRTDLPAFAREVTRDETSELGRSQAIVRWLAQNLAWLDTDYQKRTVQQIVERKGGNCNDLAMVATSAMRALDIRLRQVHEVNLQAPSEERANTARRMVAERGAAFSIFGRRHNDHIWLELYDSKRKEWLPADPSSGLVGLDDWMQGRVGFGKRVSLNPITNDMIVPIAVFAADDSGRFTISRTRHYLVESFDAMYGGKLKENPAWREWIATLDALDPEVAGAFAGKIDLQESQAQLDALADIYERLKPR